MSTLSWRALLSEAWRDCLSGTARVGILTVLATALVGGVICADAFSLRSVSVEAASFRVHLGSVRVLQAQGSIDGATCEALSRIPGVRAGAVRSVESGLSPLALPASSLPLYEVTPGTVSLLGTTSADPTGILLPEQVAEELGTSQGALLPLVPLAHGQAEVAGTYPWDENDGRRPGYAYAALAPVPAMGTFDECWYESWPHSDDVDALVRSTLVGSDDQNAQVLAMNPTRGTTFDAAGQLRHRPTWWAWIAASTIGVVVGASTTWWRRLEIASALHAGFRTSDTTFLQLCEAVSWVGCAFVLTSAICLTILSGAPPSDRSDLMRLVATEGICAASWTLIGVVIASTTIRERQLFAFFKGR